MYNITDDKHPYFCSSRASNSALLSSIPQIAGQVSQIAGLFC